MESISGLDTPARVAIQGEAGSNSHMAALQVLNGAPGEIVACSFSTEVFERLANGTVTFAVLPIENSLHGSVFEHYDLLLDSPVSIIAETTLHIAHNIIAAPGVTLAQIRRIKSHPVALSQCRRWLREHPAIEAVPFYDTAGSVKELMAAGFDDSAGIAPLLAAAQYGAQVLVQGIEDHRDNYTRFYVLVANPDTPSAAPELRQASKLSMATAPTKASLAFSVQHRPGSLISALEVLRDAGLNLTKIESRPVTGSPWEYVFFVDVRFADQAMLDAALDHLKPLCEMVRELGRYVASANPVSR